MTAAGDVLVAVDVGTSGARAAALDLDGRRLGEVRHGYPSSTPRPQWVEQSPDDWRRASLAALRELARSLPRSRRIAAISLTGQCPSMALVDDRGRPVRPGLTYRDNRADPEARALRERFGATEFHERTGHLPAAFHVAPKLLWLRRHEPDAWRRAATVLQPRDLVVRELTGETVTDGTHAAATLLMNLRTRQWDRELLDALELPPSLLPRIARSDEVIGTVRPAVADRLAIPATTPVVLGGADSQACAFGAGVIEPGPVSEMAGSSTCLNGVVAEPLADLDVTHYPHVVGEQWTTETGINTTGSAVAWVADRMYAGRRGRATTGDYVRLDAEVAAASPGADGILFVPALADGERTDPTLRGAFTGLSLRHARGDVARGVMEGVAFVIRAQLDLLRAADVPVTELRVSGGDTRLRSWSRIKADITDLPVVTVSDDAAVTGVAMLAGLGAGLYGSADEAIRHCVQLDDRVEPRAANRAMYQAAYDAFRRLVASDLVRRQEA